MSDISGVSGSGGAHQSQDTSKTSTSSADQAQLNQQQDDAYEFLQQELISGLTAQKAILPDKG